jgi:ABC-type antimicrobial peptide transport system permease subunit
VSVDKRFKQALVNETWKLGNADVYNKMKKAVEKTPSRDAYEESLAHFGDSLSALCKMTADLVDELEFHHPGIGRWLEISGHGNDKDMIEAMVAWVTFVNPPATVA